MSFLTEADLEAALLAQLAELGYQTATEAEIGPDGTQLEREGFSEVVLLARLSDAIDRLNPEISLVPTLQRRNAVRALQRPVLALRRRRRLACRQERSRNEARCRRPC